MGMICMGHASGITLRRLNWIIRARPRGYDHLTEKTNQKALPFFSKPSASGTQVAVRIRYIHIEERPSEALVCFLSENGTMQFLNGGRRKQRRQRKNPPPLAHPRDLQVIQLQSTEKMQALAPTVKEINEKFGQNKEAATAATNRLYKETNVNPLIGCLPALLQVL